MNNTAVYRVRQWRSGGQHNAELVRAPAHRADMPRDITGVDFRHFEDKLQGVEFRYDAEIELEWA
jgi:hypothetical protein